MGRFILIATAVVALGAGLAYWTGQLPFAGSTVAHADNPAGQTTDAGEEVPQPVEIGADLYPAPATPAPAVPAKKFGADPVVIGECVINLGEQAKQDVPAQRDGVILFIGTNVSDEEWAKLPQGRQIETVVAGKRQKYRKLREGDEVTNGQLLAVVDDRVAFAERESKLAKVEAAKADRNASEAMANEAKAQWETSQNLHARTGPAAPKEDVNTRRATYIRYKSETEAKGTAIISAEKEAEQALVVLGQHEIHSSIPGVIKQIFKGPGEAVKSQPSYEPVFQIINLKNLRAEGLVEEQYLPYLKKGMKVVVERSVALRPMLTLGGHFHEVTGVAVTKDANPRIVSSSLDDTVRVWDRASGLEVRKFQHPTDVKAVACTPAGAKANLCLSGDKDGVARIWDLDGNSTKPLRTLAGKHRGAINCVAFSPDGAVCATGGDDREICLWDTATGELKYRLLGHTGAVTSVQFLPDSQLVSAAKDGYLRLWKLGKDAGRFVTKIGDRRSGDVAKLGVSPDGKYTLFDPYQSKALSVLSLPEGRMVGGLKNPSGAGQFNTLAKFSPDGQTILTAGSDGRLQLWRSPLSTGRAYVLRQLESEDRAQPICGAFAPNGSFVVAGTKDKNVLVWPVPKKEEIEQLRTATVVYIDPAIDTSSHQARIWADLDDGEGISPGTTVTLVRYPGK